MGFAAVTLEAAMSIATVTLVLAGIGSPPLAWRYLQLTRWQTACAMRTFLSSLIGGYLGGVYGWLFTFGLTLEQLSPLVRIALAVGFAANFADLIVKNLRVTIRPGDMNGV
jgi:hypothetical protein